MTSGASWSIILFSLLFIISLRQKQKGKCNVRFKINKSVTHLQPFFSIQNQARRTLLIIQLPTFFFLPLLALGTSEESFCSMPKNKKQVSFQSSNILTKKTNMHLKWTTFKILNGTECNHFILIFLSPKIQFLISTCIHIHLYL